MSLSEVMPCLKSFSPAGPVLRPELPLSLGSATCDIVLCDSVLQPAKVKPLPRTVHIWAKSDIPQMKKDIDDFAAELVRTDSDTSVEDTWHTYMAPFSPPSRPMSRRKLVPLNSINNGSILPPNASKTGKTECGQRQSRPKRMLTGSASKPCRRKIEKHVS